MQETSAVKFLRDTTVCVDYSRRSLSQLLNTIYLFIMNDRTIRTYIVQEKSANKVIKKLRQRKMRNQVTHIVVSKHATIRKN